MTSLDNGLGREQAKQEAVSRSLGLIEDEVLETGYEPDPVFTKRTLDGRYIATAWGGEGGRYRAQAIGETPVAAAQSLVRSLRRPYTPPKRRQRRNRGNYQR